MGKIVDLVKLWNETTFWEPQLDSIPIYYISAKV